MINEVKIQWVNDGEIEWVNVADFEWNENISNIDDDEIFFYGLSREELADAMMNHEAIEGEWYVIEIGA